MSPRGVEALCPLGALTCCEAKGTEDASPRSDVGKNEWKGSQRGSGGSMFQADRAAVGRPRVEGSSVPLVCEDVTGGARTAGRRVRWGAEAP